MPPKSLALSEKDIEFSLIEILKVEYNIMPKEFILEGKDYVFIGDEFEADFERVVFTHPPNIGNNIIKFIDEVVAANGKVSILDLTSAIGNYINEVNVKMVQGFIDKYLKNRYNISTENNITYISYKHREEQSS